MKTQGWQMAIAIGLGMSGAIAALPTYTLAQVVADPSIGTIVTPNGTTFEITNGTTVGRNLFHSFSRFDVPTGGVASFLNNPNIVNIFSRVTGGTASQIDGILRSAGTANLFLMNPSGIIFGQNAQLDIGGSFVATTANAIQFGDRGSFSASLPNVPSSLLTVNPSAFLFNQINVAPIQSNSASLGVGDRQNLLLLGGNVILDGSFLGVADRVGGRAELGGLVAPGRVDLAIDGGLFRLSFPNDVLRGDVTLKNGSTVNVVAGSGGSLAIHARNLSILGGSSLVAGIGSGLGSPNSQAGDITLDATGIIVDQSSSIKNDVSQNAVGNGGNIDIKTGSLSLRNGAVIRASTFGNGNAGNIDIQASDQVTLNNSYIVSNVQSSDAIGNGGAINIRAGSILVQSGAQVNAFTRGQGNAGNVTIHADFVDLKGISSDGQNWSGISSNVISGAKGNGGDLTVNTQRLRISDGARISASTFGSGNAGNVTIDASDKVEVIGNTVVDPSNNNSYFLSKIVTDVEEDAKGNSGTLFIETPHLIVADGAQISSSTFGQGNAGNIAINADSIDIYGIKNPYPAGIFVEVGESVVGEKVRGGDLTITTQRLSIRNGAKISGSTFGKGNAGSVTIDASDKVEVIGSEIVGVPPDGYFLSKIASDVVKGATGNSGNLTIETPRLVVKDGAEVSASTFGKGNAGDLTVHASDFIELTGESPGTGGKNGYVGGLLAQVDFTGEGHGGNLTIETRRLDVSDGSKVQTATFGKGDAGNLFIRASEVNVFETDNPGVFTAAINAGVTRGPGNSIVPKGNGGNLTIETERLSVRSGGEVTVGTFGNGNAGTLRIIASDSAEVVGTSLNGQRRSRVSAEVGANSTGNGGSLFFEAGQLSIRDGGIITSRSQGQQPAGNVNINVHGILKANNGDISTSSVQAGGGNINIAARNIFLRGNSDITTDSGASNGGNITLTANSIIALNDSDILAFAQQGKGGNITLTTRAFFGQNYRPGSPAPWDGNNRVDINASGTISGIITLPDVSFLQNGLTEFLQTFTDTTQLLANSCIVRSSKQNGRFVITGSGGLPLRPGDAPLSSFPTGEVRGEEVRGEERGVRSAEGQGKQGEQGESYVIQNSTPGTQQVPDRPWKIGDPIVEPQGVYKLANGELVMSRECK